MQVTVNEGNPLNQLSIATRCRSVDEFVAMSARYVDGNSLFVATLAMRRLGLDLVLAVMLADGTPVLRGRAVVRKAWATADNPFRLPGLLLGIRALTLGSKQVFDRVRVTAARAKTHRGVTPPPDVAKSEPTSDDEAAFTGVERTLIGPPLSHNPNVEPQRTTPLRIIIPDVTKPLTRSAPRVPATPVQPLADAPAPETDLANTAVEPSAVTAVPELELPRVLIQNEQDEDDAATARFAGAQPAQPVEPAAPWSCARAVSEPPSRVTAQARGVTTGRRKLRALALLPIAVAAMAILQVRGGEATLTIPAAVAAPVAIKRVSDEPPVRAEPIQRMPSRVTVEIDGKPYIIEVVVTPVTGSDDGVATIRP